MKCIVGLGNPGTRYRFTRHNIGFRIAESLISRTGAVHLEGNNLTECFRVSLRNDDLLIVLPQTYMNTSGESVLDCIERYELNLEDLLVVVDDFQIPFGTLRMRASGSDGGHNGLASIIYHLQSDLFPRLRFGVAGMSMPADHTQDEMARYVLGRFDAPEEKLLPQLILTAADAALSWIDVGIARTMTSFNKNFFTPGNDPG